MALRFDPVRTRASFDTFGLKRELSLSADKYPALGGAAIMRLSGIIEAWLVGLRAEIEPALKQCHDWLKKSIEANESLGGVHIPAVRCDALGLSNWMLNNQNDKAIYHEALDHYDLYFKQGWVKNGQDIFNKETQRFELNIQRGLPVSNEEILNGYLGDYLADCIQGEEYERGIKLYEKVGGNTEVDPKKIKKIVEYGYWLCQKKLSKDQFSVDEHIAVGEKILKQFLQSQWLGHGQSTRSAIWLKILYWHAGVTKTPLDTIIRAYDLMPDVPKPSFVDAH